MWGTDTMRMIERGVYHIPLTLSPSLESLRDELTTDLMNAQRRLRNFARRYEWGLNIEPCFAKRAEIYDDQRTFIGALLNSAGADPSTTLPDTVSAALENGIFMSVSPALYRSIYPQGIEQHAFEKLITHEMAHRLHIRILHGNEDSMGPLWFFEGFAIYAADQFDHVEMNTDEILAVIHDEVRGNYLKYGAAIRYFLRRIPLDVMVDHAAQNDLVDWLDDYMQMRENE
jgi:hypothetical protein